MRLRPFPSFSFRLAPLALLSLSLMPFALAGCGDEARACLGDEAYCAMKYDELAYATTHNAFAIDELFQFPNQSRSITRQLEDGVRALMLDVYDGEAEDLDAGLYSCHGGCNSLFGMRLFIEELDEIVAFLRANPNEIVTIIFESYAPPEKLLAVFEESEALAYTRAQRLDEPWPTLAELIDAGERLIVFSDRDGFAYDWHLPVFEFMRETPFAASSREDLRCGGGRGASDAGLLIFNHFLTVLTGSAELAEQINYDPFFSERIEECEAELAQKVNFITVDYYEIGDTLAIVDRINQERAGKTR